MNPSQITDKAREAATDESRINQCDPSLDGYEQGHFVQLAINAETERLKLLCADHATSQAIAESEVVQMGYKLAGLREQLRTLAEIASGLYKQLDEPTSGHGIVQALTAFTTFRALHPELWEGKEGV
jgi:hypothetical protein